MQIGYQEFFYKKPLDQMRVLSRAAHVCLSEISDSFYSYLQDVLDRESVTADGHETVYERIIMDFVDKNGIEIEFFDEEA